MPVVNVNLLLDEKTYRAVQAGDLALCGMVKDSNHRIRKHIPTVFDATKEGASKAIDIIRAHKKIAYLVGGFLIIGGAAAGFVGFLTTKKKRKASQKLGKSFDAYIEAAKEGSITIDLLDALIADLDAYAKFNKDDTIPLNLTAKQLSAWFHSIYDFTKRIAQANNVNTQNLKAPKLFKKNTVADLRNYLDFQKNIIENAA